LEVLKKIQNRNFPRRGTVIALGGGCMGDLAGLIASIWNRGVNLVQVPTSLMAMVDSSVGGKNGINFHGLKNQIGTIYQPAAVYIDPDFLKTLTHTEFQNGMAEVIKCGIIKDEALFDVVSDRITMDHHKLNWIIQRCVNIKAELVQKDEYDTKQIRSILNLGHTIGHAIESATQYEVAHGRAISVGMMVAAKLSSVHLELPISDVSKIGSALLVNGLPNRLDDGISREQVLRALKHDKKMTPAGELQWVLLRGIGVAQPNVTIKFEDVVKQLL
jgi:3-dehydroquinate synthase